MLIQKGSQLYRRDDKELLLIEPWGPNSLRVSSSMERRTVLRIAALPVKYPKAEYSVS